MSPGILRAEIDGFLIQAGYEENKVELVDVASGSTAGTLSGPMDFSTNSSPVFSIASKTYFTPSTCIIGGEPSPAGKLDGCIGLGVRVAGNQKRFGGQWFALETEPATPVNFAYDTAQVAVELLGGFISEVNPVFSVGVKAGFNNYDLWVTQQDRVLASEINKTNPFLSTTIYVNPVIILDLLFGFWFHSTELKNVAIEFSLENTHRGNNVLRVKDINGTDSHDVDLRVKTTRITLQYLFY